MRSSSILLALSALSGTSIAARNSHRDNAFVAGVVNGTTIIPRRYIVEFSAGTDRQALLAQLAARPGVTVLKTFDSDIFAGVSIETQEDNIDSLQALNTVSQVWHSKKVQLEEATKVSIADGVADSNYSIHGMTGVDRLHAKGIYGKGVKVAIVDTGVDYTHEALGGCFGPGCKVIGGYDYVGETEWPGWGPRIPDEDPKDLLGHGTHVAGILGGKGEWFTGVAPEASILAYKVFGWSRETEEDLVIEAFLKAYEDGADIITSSVGFLGGWSNNAWAVVADRLVQQGVVVTISAGNSGLAGPFYGSTGASGEHVLAVASVEGTVIGGDPVKMTFTQADGAASTIEVGYQYGWIPIPTSVNLPLIPLNFDTTDEYAACSPLPDDTPDFTGAIALVRRAIGCSASYQLENLAPHGAKYVLWYNDDLLQMEAPLDVPEDVEVGLTDSATGEFILETIKAGGSVTADFSVPVGTRYLGQYNSAGGAPNWFTSMYGTNTLELKPDIAAPGGSILSTYLGSGWATMSGTSMAAPYVAGIAALYISQHGGRSKNGPDFAKDLAMRIISSGRALPWVDTFGNTGYGLYSPTIETGGGLVDAVKVLEYHTRLSYAKFNLNDTHHHSRYHDVDITNNGATEVVYTFSLQEHAGFETWTPLDEFIPNSPGFRERPELVPDKFVPTVKFPSGTFKVKPGQTKKANFVINYPTGLNAKNLPIYTGKILIRGSNGEELSVPYFGMAADLSNDMEVNAPLGYPYGWSFVTTEDSPVHIKDKNWFTFNLSMLAQDFLHIEVKTKWAMQELRFDIFESGWKEKNWQYPPVAGQNGYIGSGATWAIGGGSWHSFFNPLFDDVTYTVSFPIQSELPRQLGSGFDYSFYWMGRLANGSFIAPGNYSIRFANLDPFGNPDHSDNWDVLPQREISILDYYHFE